jgi:short-subunit dehydrogenase
MDRSNGFAFIILGGYQSMNILIYGASGGIGKALCLQLKNHHNLYLVGRSMSKLKSLAKELDLPGQQLFELKDFKTDFDQFVHWLQKYNQVFDIGIHCAGIGNQKKVIDLSISEIENTININLVTSFLFYQAFSAVKCQTGFDLVYLGSAGTDEVWPKNALYGATKAGLEYFCQSLQKEIKSEKGRIWYYKVGSVNTGFFNHLKNHLSREKMIQPENLAKIIVQNLEVTKDTNIHFPVITIRSD